MIYKGFRSHLRAAPALIAACCAILAKAGAVPAEPPSGSPAAAPAATPTVSSPSLTAPMSAAEVITFLDQTVDWYRILGLQQQAANEPSDLLFLNANRQTAAKVMTLAFDIARADADLLADASPAARQSGAESGTSSQALLQFQQKLDAQAATVQAELDAQRRHASEAKLEELQGELDLVNTKRGIVSTMIGFTAGAANPSTAAALKAQIDAMAVAMPSAGVAAAPPGGAAATAQQAGPAAAPSTTILATSNRPVAGAPSGLWDLASDVFRLSEKAATIDSVDQRTLALQTLLSQVQTPLIDQMKLLSARGDALANTADSADSTMLKGVHDQLDALAAQFKRASSLVLPFSQESMLLAQYRHNLANWHATIDMQYRAAVKTLGIRAAVLVAILLVLFGAAELWQRTVLHYVQDSRRRYQLLLLRRIALWALVVVVIGFAFASELGSLVTFAGLITAGIAVAMQSVLVSIVGYFFLIGNYGIRVGDRVQIGEVAGEVIDLGLVRMYLMELGARGAMGPTGRVVAFANSVVFQVAGGLFKQIPGVNFSWREVVLTLPAGADYPAIKRKLLASVAAALAQYNPEILRQTREIARTMLSASAGDAEAQVQLHFSGSTVEAIVRYPVHLPYSGEIDERVTEALATVVKGAATDAATAT